MRDVGRSRLSKRPPAAKAELRSVFKKVVSKEHPFFPTITVVIDIDGVGASPKPEEGGGVCVVQERDLIVARKVGAYVKLS